MGSDKTWDWESAKAELVAIFRRAIDTVSIREGEIRAELDLDELESITFANLQRASEVFGTKLINLTGERERYYSAQTGGDPSVLELVIEGVETTGYDYE